MCRGQRENHKLSAVPCCGKKKCEELYLESVVTEGDVWYRANQIGSPIYCETKPSPYPGTTGQMSVTKCEYADGTTIMPPILRRGYYEKDDVNGGYNYKEQYLSVDVVAKIKVLNYPPYQTGHSCTIKDQHQVCIDIPIANPAFLPKTAKESKWYGKTVFTNFINCRNQHGKFQAFNVAKGDTKNFGASPSFYGDVFFWEDPDKSFPCNPDSDSYCLSLHNWLMNNIKNGKYSNYSIVMASDVGLCTVE